VLAAVLGMVLVGVLALSLAGRAAPSAVTTAPGDAVVVRQPAAYGAAGQPVPARAVYVVQPGDTIWSIARKLDPTGDTRAMVDHIVALNGGAALEPGQRLRLSDDK
jgi:Tfp pilus assembly protein FimV